MTKFLKKSQRPHFGAILGPFYPNLGKKEFSWVKGFCRFSNILIIYHRTKNQKKVMIHPREKSQTHRRTDGGSHRQTT